MRTCCLSFPELFPEPCPSVLGRGHTRAACLSAHARTYVRTHPPALLARGALSPCPVPTPEPPGQTRGLRPFCARRDPRSPAPAFTTPADTAGGPHQRHVRERKVRMRRARVIRRVRCSSSTRDTVHPGRSARPSVASPRWPCFTSVPSPHGRKQLTLRQDLARRPSCPRVSVDRPLHRRGVAEKCSPCRKEEELSPRALIGRASGTSPKPGLCSLMESNYSGQPLSCRGFRFLCQGPPLRESPRASR